MLLFVLTPRPQRSTLFPYTTLFRSHEGCVLKVLGARAGGQVADGSGHDVAAPGILDRDHQVERLHQVSHPCRLGEPPDATRSEEHTSELQSRPHLVCRLLLEKKKLM